MVLSEDGDQDGHHRKLSNYDRGQVRFPYLVAVLSIGLPELRLVRIDRMIARLNEMMARVASLTNGSI